MIAARLLLLSAAAAAAAGWTIEYNAYPGAEGTRSVAVHGKVRAVRDVDVDVIVQFDRDTNTSSLTGEVFETYPLYFQRVGFLLEGSNTREQGIAFQDFADTSDDGVFIARKTIGSGKPPVHEGDSVVATTACDGPLHACAFEGSVGNRPFEFIASPAYDHHIVPEDMANKVTTITTESGELIIDTRDYNSFAIGTADVLLVSVPAAGLTVWQNATHVELWSQPSGLSAMQDLLSMILMVVALVGIVDISSATTQRMAAAPVLASEATWLTCVVIVDITTTAAFVVGLRIVNGMHFVDVSMHGLEPNHKHAKNATAFVALCVASAVVIATVADRKYNFLKHKAAWWVWTRASFEASVVMAASSSAPAIAGEQFVLAVRFATGLVISFVLGRDLAFASNTSTWQLGTLALLHAGMFQYIIAETLVAPVFFLSQSFPSTNSFILLLAHAVAASTMCAGASMAPKKKKGREVYVPNDQEGGGGMPWML